jgi:type VI secretion system protein ImpJ
LTPSDITAIGLLAAVNRHLPLFRNFATGAGCHPEQLYLSMLSLGGELSAYTADASFHPREFPVYDHADLTGCVNNLMAAIERALGGAQPSQHYRQVPLTIIRENLFQAEVTAEELAGADFIVSAKSSDFPESRLVSELPSMLRVAAPEMIDSVLQSYTRALAVEHTSRLPVGMPEDPLASYFRLERSGPFWDGIRESRKLAIFIPAEFASVDLKLAVVLRG